MKQNYKLPLWLKSITTKTNKICSLLIVLLFGLPPLIYSQQSYTFTNCGATSSVGPTQSQVTASYVATNLSLVATTNPTSGIQTWTVPFTGNYRIEARGAQGGTSASVAGCLGAIMIGDFSLIGGEVLRILVGQVGDDGGTGPGGGGGGSFVVRTPYTTTTSALLVAGGGSGNGTYTCSPGLTTTSGGLGGVAGGVNGLGGSGGTRGAGGGGFLTDGDPCNVSTTYASPGIAFINGGKGGFATGNPTCLFTASGGFGGGSSSGGNCINNGGAGGGFSGGGGSSNTNSGGGGSLNQGINQVNTAGVNVGNGRVIITELCSVRIFASGTNSLAPSICSGNSLTLTTTAVSNYTWSNGNTTTTSIVVSPTTSQTYSIVGTSSAACQASGSISVTVSSGLPVLTITNTPNSICLGKTASLTAGGAISYTWAGGPGGVINGQTFTPTATSNYTVTGQNGCGTTTSVTTITVAPLAVSASASSTLVCSGSPATLTAASAVSGYTWYPIALPGNIITVAPVANTVYTVVASDGTCSGVATISLTTKPNPTLSIVASSQTVCEGAIVTMTASGAVTYTWTSPSSNSPSISDTPTTATLYQVTGTSSLNCVASANQIIFTQPTPVVTVTSDKTIVCSGNPANLTASGATTYNWTNGPATAGNIVNPTSNTTYTVTGTTTPCSSSQTITINVLTASVAASVSTPSICNGASTDLHANGATTYAWVGLSSFNGNVTVTPSVTTVYIVNATTTAAGLSCPSTTNITVTVFNNPTVTIVTTKTFVCKTDAPLVLTGAGATTYTWSTATVSANISVHPQSTTTYSITGVDANGCMNTASQFIQVSACAGIAELTNRDKNISVYPNPNNGEFVVSSDSEINLKLINELGQEIKVIKLSEQNDYKVSITNLANGIYFIVGQNENGKVNQKIVVSK